jgi:hypothetical protein
MQTLLILISTLILAACATPHDKTVVVNGQPVIAHIDYTDNPCGTRGPEAGCTQIINGVRHIWISGAAPAHVTRHEIDHGPMQHKAWRQHRYFGWCAEITVGAPGYPLGGLICHNEGRRERIIQTGYADDGM